MKRHPNIEGWLFTTIKNLIKNELGRANYRNECKLDEESLAMIPERYKSLEDALPDALSPVDRQILLWYYEEELDMQEIGRRLNLSEGTIRVKIYRARKRTEKFFEKKKKGVTKSASEYIYK